MRILSLTPSMPARANTPRATASRPGGSEPPDRSAGTMELAHRAHTMAPPVQVKSLPWEHSVEHLGDGVLTGHNAESTCLLSTEGKSFCLPRKDNHFFYAALRTPDRFYAVDATRRSLMAFDSELHPLWDAPSGVADGNLHPPVETEKGDVFFSGASFAAVVGRDGSERWSYRSPHLSAPVGHCSAHADGTGYLGGADWLEAIREGKPAWSCERRGLVFSRLCPDGRGGLVAAAFTHTPPGGRILAFDADGNLRWERQTREYNRALQPAVGPRGEVYAVDQGGNLYAFEPDGSLRWERRTQDQHTPDDLFTPTRSGDQYPTSPVVDGDGNVFVGYGRSLLCFDPEGKLRGKLVIAAAEVRPLEPFQVPQLDSRGILALHDGGKQLFSIDTHALLNLKSQVEKSLGKPVPAIEVESDRVRIGGIVLPVRR
ncbi:MAG: PQQ-binding-like beta-propeller repeat protein [Armatimonadetes bacterium]|nr:PQQ-binding-like beta-propeller repeat protein [Armatimonadota bacterium]